MIRLSGLHLYPMKSAKGVAVPRWRVDDFGLAGDRRFMLVDSTGRFLTQRQHPKMTHLRATLTDAGLSLTAPGRGELAVERPSGAAAGEVQIWGEQVLGHDVGEAAAEWLTAWLGEPCRLVFMADDTRRPVDPEYADETARVSFADGFPFLLIGEASLAELNTRLAKPMPMTRFRPNLVITGAPAFAEDAWRRIRIDRITFDVVKPCGRCSITTVDPDSGEVGKEPLRTLATFRKVGREVMFGQNLLHQGTGTLTVGAEVEVLERT